MPSDRKNKVVIVTGPTASGKTALGVRLAGMFGGEIISADSRQVYRGMDIGTGKDICEYHTAGNNVKYHLIDIVDPGEEYNLKRFFVDAHEKIREIYGRGAVPVIVGGSALYIDALVSGYEFPLSPPDFSLRKEFAGSTASQIAELIRSKSPLELGKVENINSRPRLMRVLENISASGNFSGGCRDQEQYEWLILAPFFDRKVIHARIEKRLEDRLNSGMIDEVKSLHDKGISWERLDSFGLEYRYISLFLRGELGFDEMKKTLLARIRRLARSQDIWFRKMENKGVRIYWIKDGNINEASDIVGRFLRGVQLPDIKIKLSEIYYGAKTQ